MNFDLNKSLEILKRTPDVLDAQLKDLPAFWSEGKEAVGRWSAMDVVAHLIHGEIEDWIPRAKIILFEKNKQFPPFNPSGFGKILQNKTMDKLLNDFRKLRESNIRELKKLNLSENDFQKTGIHPEFGEVTLHQHLSTWTVHDLNHLYQISRAVGKQYSEDIGPWKKYLRLVRD
ncbi:MAG TPA: DinB family protein [Cyclobacteriaceae bacterium]|jgi:hypothetical protein